MATATVKISNAEYKSVTALNSDRIYELEKAVKELQRQNEIARRDRWRNGRNKAKGH